MFSIKSAVLQPFHRIEKILLRSWKYLKLVFPKNTTKKMSSYSLILCLQHPLLNLLKHDNKLSNYNSSHRPLRCNLL